MPNILVCKPATGRRCRPASLVGCILCAALAQPVLAQIAPAVAPASMQRLGTVSERFQSYNVEMLEVTGGKFWKPYGPELEQILAQGAASPAPASGGDTPSGMNPGLYQYRPPLDLGNARLRKMAAALGPAYVRVSGTWANTTYLAQSKDAPASTPPGYGGVLTQEQWKGVVDFSRATNAAIVTSFATGVGTRNASGVWTPAQARHFLAYTKAIGGRIAAAEFMNEPTLAAMGGAPAGYDERAYGRDFRIFRNFAKRAAPGMIILGPGSVGETDAEWGVAYAYGSSLTLKTRELLAASGPGVDAFSYHHYGAASMRCAPMKQTTREAAMTEQWLARTDETLSFYRRLRDEFEPGKPMWLTEVADAACGGNPWAATFLDSFRYLDQLGRLAKQGVQVVMHNTLVASDYGLLDDSTFAPKPNYWAALLWRKLMGTTVLESGIASVAGLHTYAHCLRGVPGGVALMVINNDTQRAQALAVPTAALRYTLSSPELLGTRVELNARPLELGGGDSLPVLAWAATPAGDLQFAPATITFLALEDAGNRACR